MNKLLNFLVGAGLSLLIFRGDAQAAAANVSFTGTTNGAYSIPYNNGTSAVVVMVTDCASEHNVVSYCSASSTLTTAKISVTGATYNDSKNITLGLTSNGPPEIYSSNGTGGTGVLTLRLNPNASTPSTSDTILDVEGGSGIMLKAEHALTGLHAANATINITLPEYDTQNSDIEVSANSAFSSAATTFKSGDSVYVRVNAKDRNTIGYSTQNLTNATVISSSVDTVTIPTLTESDNNTGLFHNTAAAVTVATYDGSANSSDQILKISPRGETNISVTYTDPGNTSDTAIYGTTITADSVVQDFAVTASSPQTAGTVFVMNITARDSSGATLTGYSSTVTLTTNYISPSSGSSVITPNSDISLTNGVVTINNAAYADAGTITITATDTNSKTGTSGNILFLPANFLVESTSGNDQIVGKAFNVKVTARNSANAACPNYNRDVSLTASSVTPSGTSPTISPTTISGSSFSSGAKTVSMTYNKWGTAKITATDSGYSTVTGSTSSAINFYPNNFSVSVASPPESRSKFYLEELFDVTVSPLDYSANVITNYAGSITFPTVSDIDIPDDYTFLSSDSGQHSFTISGDKEKTFKLKVSDTAYASAAGESSDISLMYGKIRVKDASGPIGTVNTVVELVDKDGDVITSDDSTTFIVTLSESNDNNTAAAVTSDLTVSGGTTAIGVTDTELESVTVTPDSTPYLEPESGTVTFSETAVGGGGAAKFLGAGARVLWWREIRSQELGENRESK